MTKIDKCVSVDGMSVSEAYQKGYIDGNADANNQIKPLIQTIHDLVYQQGIAEGYKQAKAELEDDYK